MSKKERQRLLVMSRVKDQGMSLIKAATVLSISYRQARRIYKRYIADGDAGLVHGNRGKTSGRGFSVEIKQSALELYKTRYEGFGPTLAAEKLLEEDGVALDHETLRRWLIADGLWTRRRKRNVYRQRRIPRSHFGELVQMDGSHHPWFEDRGGQSCLMNMVDDATKTTLSLMDKGETVYVSMLLLWNWIDKYGIPESLYVDHKNIFKTDREPTLQEQLRGEIPLTHFGRAAQKLGIQIIRANSPQAKGRVERNHGVYQDRLVKEFRLKGTDTIEEANELLVSGFVDKLNSKFAIAPAESKNRHRPVGKSIDLAAIFCYEYQRRINNDYTVRFKSRVFQIAKQSALPPTGAKLLVQKRLDDGIHLIYQDRELEFIELSRQEAPQPVIEQEKTKKSTAHVPPPDHPWRSTKRVRQPMVANQKERTLLTS